MVEERKYLFNIDATRVHCISVRGKPCGIDEVFKDDYLGGIFNILKELKAKARGFLP